MTDLNLHDFSTFLKELDKDLKSLDSLSKEESDTRKRMRVLHDVMSKMCQNWENQLKNP